MHSIKKSVRLFACLHALQVWKLMMQGKGVLLQFFSLVTDVENRFCSGSNVRVEQTRKTDRVWIKLYEKLEK